MPGSPLPPSAERGQCSRQAEERVVVPLQPFGWVQHSERCVHVADRAPRFCDARQKPRLLVSSQLTRCNFR